MKSFAMMQSAKPSQESFRQWFIAQDQRDRGGQRGTIVGFLAGLKVSLVGKYAVVHAIYELDRPHARPQSMILHEYATLLASECLEK